MHFRKSGVIIGLGWMFVCSWSCAAAESGHAQLAFAQQLQELRAERAGESVIDSATATATDMRRLFAAVPLAFEENRGQFDAPVRYAARGVGQTLFLTPDEAVVALQPNPSQPASAIRLRFDGAAGTTTVAGEEALPTQTHYFTGHDTAAWRTGVPSFGKVRYSNVYPGIDVVYYGKQRQLEYDFVLAPGANAQRIDMRFDGVDKVEIDGDGDLVLKTRAGNLTQKKPIVWQIVDGKHRRIDARFMRRGRGIGIALAPYDRHQPLIIDPQVLFYATYLGGSVMDKTLAIAADTAGNTYVAGLTQSIDFPIANAAQPAKSSTTDAFVAKLNPNGTALVYATYLGGNGIDAAVGIARDAMGNAYITGYTVSTDFPVTPDALQSTLHGSAYDAFVTQLAADGTLHYSTYLGGSDVDMANAIATDGVGYALVAGFTCSADFPLANAFQPQLAGMPIGCFTAKDAFVSKVEIGAPALLYSSYLGGSGGDEAKAIAVDAQHRVAITGATKSSNFPLAGVALSAYAGGSDAFVSRLTAQGTLDYSTPYGGTADDVGLGIATDSSGSLYIAGSTQSTDFPIVTAFQPDLHGPADGFVAEFIVHTGAREAAAVAYASFLGGRDEDVARAIAVDSLGFAYVTGETRSLDFPIQLPTQPALHGPSDAFVSRIHPAGTLTYSTFLGGNDEDAGWGIALSNGLLRGTSNMHVAGITMSTDLATGGVLQPGLQGSWDGFVSKLGYLP